MFSGWFGKMAHFDTLFYNEASINFVFLNFLSEHPLSEMAVEIFFNEESVFNSIVPIIKITREFICFRGKN